MRHFALIGSTLTHSYSKSLFDAQHFPDADYSLCPLASAEELRRWVEHGGVDGFNVTAPYKQAVIPLLDEVTREAQAIGAVNCVALDHGRLVGHNTDAPAFHQTLQTLLQSGNPARPQGAALSTDEKNQFSEKTIKHSFILGTGGAAHAVAHVLRQLGIPYTFVSRHPEQHENAISYNQLSILNSQSSILINATPVGMYPDNDVTPLPSNFQFSLLNTQLVYDLVYNPSPTLLLQHATQYGAHTKDGLEMLRLQAQMSWKIWGLV